jgi:hypothetical protein
MSIANSTRIDSTNEAEDQDGIHTTLEFTTEDSEWKPSYRQILIRGTSSKTYGSRKFVWAKCLNQVANSQCRGTE